MLTISYSARFKKDYRLIKKRGYDIRLMEEVLEMLCSKQQLPQKYCDHALTGNYHAHRECHITPDWLLIYEVVDEELILNLTRTGTHSDLF
jgi:mRNA interferase YafQ